MSVGDLVRWIGFPGASSPDNILGKGQGIVIIVAQRPDHIVWPHDVDSARFDVLWKDGTIGHNLYAETMEKIV